jgi:hypothetical protein
MNEISCDRLWKVFLFDASPLSRVPFIPVCEAAGRTAKTLPRTLGPKFRSTMVAGSFAHLGLNFVLDHSANPQRMRCNGNSFGTPHLHSDLMVARPPREPQNFSSFSIGRASPRGRDAATLSFRLVQPSDLDWPVIRSRHCRLLRRFVQCAIHQLRKRWPPFPLFRMAQRRRFNEQSLATCRMYW